MQGKLRARLTYANVMSSLAVFMLLGGVAWAAGLPTNSVGAKQLKRNAVTSKKIKNGQVTGADVKNRSLTAAEFATGTQLQGPAGKDGSDGRDGAPGTARAYAIVIRNCTGPAGNETCPVLASKGISGVVRTATGFYCVTAPGVDATTTPSVVSVYWANTNSPEGNTSAMVSGSCGADGFGVVTERQVATDVRNATDDGSASVAGNASDSNTVAFTIAIP